MTTEQAAEHDTATFGLDDPWLAEPPKRSKLRLVLVILLAAAVLFYGGVEMQKRYGTASSAAATGLPTGFTPPDGANLPSDGQFPGGGTGDDSTGDQGTGTSVIGTVVSLKGDRLVVKDFGGKKHTIVLDSDVRVVLETAGSADDVTRGSTVQVDGQADDQGQVTATTITVR
jgi:hypothetical protein